ncbi:hypothetical protein SCLCIDRAFT_19565 [Scleroderma citrinum Foug A]|uniref:Uncharacterized protein n=1 Tax=Scleroderma citrinum Foug A TaxID=1036808 RepID=A0A0C3EAN4_9AGAM|nr:hypothetical protein SCLCIDRAFT_19565 [Scleroderma citrinum Foug A]
MDSGKLPNYKSSYLLRFHPYPRVRPSARERVMTALEAADEYSMLSYDKVSTSSIQSADFDDAAFETTQNLNDAIHIMQSFGIRQRRRLSFSSLIVASKVASTVEQLIHDALTQDLAFLARKPSSGV